MGLPGLTNIITRVEPANIEEILEIVNPMQIPRLLPHEIGPRRAMVRREKGLPAWKPSEGPRREYSEEPRRKIPKLLDPLIQETKQRYEHSYSRKREYNAYREATNYSVRAEPKINQMIPHQRKIVVSDYQNLPPFCEVITTKRGIQAACFFGNKFALSNFYPTHFQLEGRKWNSVEQYYCHKKAKHF
uniref:Uncharacterized protein n=1 Tax=Meloidogyne enterolobii TaxID=390850 RepID=A0A6V7WDT2_MELEN|nr:unnamed protein product [Meloidogyne enterolobii]